MRKGFTLIELIFVIIIIGILAGVAIPKYKGMQQNAEVTNVFKVVQEAISSVPAAYLNLQDLNGTDANITDIFEVKGSPYWSINATYNASSTALEYKGKNGDLNATILIDHTLNPPALKAEIKVPNDSTNLKYQKLKRLVSPNATFNGVYTVSIELQ